MDDVAQVFIDAEVVDDPSREASLPLVVPGDVGADAVWLLAL